MSAAAGTMRAAPEQSMRRFARGGMLNIGGSAVAAVSQFLLIGIVARAANETVAGAFFVLVAFAQLMIVIPSLGAGTGLVYFVSRRRAVGDKAGITAALRSGLTPVVVTSVAVGVGVLVLAPWIAGWIGVGEVEGGAAAVRVLGLAIPCLALLTTLSSACRGFGSYGVTVVTEQLVVPLGQLVLVFFTAGAGLFAMTAGWSVPVVTAAALAAAGLTLLYRRAMHSTRPIEAPAPAEERSFWDYTTPLALVTVLKAIVQRADVIALGALAAPFQVVLYVAASRYLVLAQVANRAMMLTIQPRVAGAMATGDRRRAGEAYTAATAWLVLISWPVSLGCILFSGTLLEIVGGESMRAGSRLLVILSSSMLVAAACGNVEAVLAMLGRSRFNLLTATLGAVVNIGLLILLIPSKGPEGAAWAWAAAILVGNVMPTIALASMEHLHPFGRPTLVAMGLSLVSTLGVGGLVRLVGGDRLITLMVAVLAAGAVQLAGVALLRRQLALGGRRRANVASS